jgi:hypothetical protein
VGLGLVQARRRGVLGSGVVERPREARPPRDVRGGVLVEERVPEDDAGLADARGDIDERELPEAASAVVARGSTMYGQSGIRPPSA